MIGISGSNYLVPASCPFGQLHGSFDSLGAGIDEVYRAQAFRQELSQLPGQPYLGRLDMLPIDHGVHMSPRLATDGLHNLRMTVS